MSEEKTKVTDNAKIKLSKERRTINSRRNSTSNISKEDIEGKNTRQSVTLFTKRKAQPNYLRKLGKPQHNPVKCRITVEIKITSAYLWNNTSNEQSSRFIKQEESSIL